MAPKASVNSPAAFGKAAFGDKRSGGSVRER